MVKQGSRKGEERKRARRLRGSDGRKAKYLAPKDGWARRGGQGKGRRD